MPEVETPPQLAHLQESQWKPHFALTRVCLVFDNDPSLFITSRVVSITASKCSCTLKTHRHTEQLGWSVCSLTATDPSRFRITFFLSYFLTQILRQCHKDAPHCLTSKHSSSSVMHRNFLAIKLHQLERHWFGQSPALRYVSVVPSPLPKAFSEKETAHRSGSQHHYFRPCLPASCCKAASQVFLWNTQGRSPRSQEHRQKTKSLKASTMPATEPFSRLVPQSDGQTTRHKQDTQLCCRPNLQCDSTNYVFIFWNTVVLPWAKNYLRWMVREGKTAPLPLVLLFTSKILWGFFRS